ncbi:ATP-dependent helicase/nuclease subunit A [Planctomycetes bacterium Poly30]|uniref:DNA 3'-5' helicase n=1 Tax=Saltatorellus ferox TaxID=2528018 RepID=A0A518EXC5_9BACT|nr:ATP-dependent helicase/nuclease subunit A [Planctomycetes bacterium Poly30]
MSGQGQLFVDDLFSSDAVNPHRLLLASAGTGKTFQLANHFAGLLVCGVEPDRVLATTFTRKAAGEILDRVLGRVREAARDDETGVEARGFLLKTIERMNPEAAAAGLSAAHCTQVLAALVRRIDRFQIRTLDAFFVRLARLFAMELAIAAEWRITDVVEERALVAEAVARVLDGLEFPVRLELLRGMTRGAEQLGAERALVETVESAEEIARDAVPGAWRKILPLEGPSAAELQDAIRTTNEAPVPLTKSKTPMKRWESTLAELRDLLEAADSAELPKALLGNSLVQRALADEPYDRREIDPELKDALVLLGRQVIVQRVQQLIDRNLASEAFLTHFTDADRNLRAELGAYRFQDFPRALLEGPARQASETWTTELGYRLDARLDHLLLDEFQDTAPSQWQLLLPLAQEVLGDGTGERSFFCVGDVKQSIYGWRGGEPRLLQRMAQRHPVLEPETLTQSYRSSSIVMDTTNRIFESIAEAACLQGPDRRSAYQATLAWAADFSEHTTAKTELAGEARLWQARPAIKDVEKTLDPCIRLAVERVAALREAHPDASIAVLVRARAQIARLRFLLGELGIEASDEGGNPLTDAMGVTWILALLQLGDHPGDGVAALQVARSPFAARYGVLPEGIGTAEGREAAQLASNRVRNELMRRGYGAFVDEHAALLGDTSSAWDVRRLEQLVELALAFDERPGLRPVDFVDKIRETRVPDPTASTVKVMTIHASKGLEFDIVVLPELGKGIRLAPSGFIGGRRNEVDPPTVATACPTKEVAHHHEQLGELYRSEEQRSMTDALSGLYVAITRAVHCVELIVPVPSKSAKTPSLQHASLVAEPLMKLGTGARDGDPEAESEEGQASLLWEHPDSDPSWSAGSGDEPVTPRVFVEERPLELKAGHGHHDGELKVASRQHHVFSSREDFPVAAEALDLFAPVNDEGRRLGVLVHALFEDYHWSNDDPRSDEELHQICTRRLPRMHAGDAEVDEALARFHSARKSKALAHLFVEPETEYRLATERMFDVEISDLDRDPMRWRGTIDRLLLRMEGDTVVGAQIVDFKTEPARDSAEILRRHRAQLEDYRRAVGELFELEEASIECLIVWLPGAGQETIVAA